MWPGVRQRSRLAAAGSGKSRLFSPMKCCLVTLWLPSQVLEPPDTCWFMWGTLCQTFCSSAAILPDRLCLWLRVKICARYFRFHRRISSRLHLKVHQDTDMVSCCVCVISEVSYYEFKKGHVEVHTTDFICSHIHTNIQVGLFWKIRYIPNIGA